MGGPVCKCRKITPERGQMVRGQVVCQKQDVDGNLFGRSNNNLILDMCLYEVEFPGKEITELVANIIAE